MYENHIIQLTECTDLYYNYTLKNLLENFKLYYDRTDVTIQANRPDILTDQNSRITYIIDVSISKSTSIRNTIHHQNFKVHWLGTRNKEIMETNCNENYTYIGISTTGINIFAT